MCLHSLQQGHLTFTPSRISIPLSVINLRERKFLTTGGEEGLLDFCRYPENVFVRKSSPFFT